MTATASRQPSVAAGAARRRMVNAWPVWLLTLATFAIYTLFALERHRQFNTAGYDLGIFDQAVRRYAHFQAPIVPLKGMSYNIWGDHFHPIIATAAPLYWDLGPPGDSAHPPSGPDCLFSSGHLPIRPSADHVAGVTGHLLCVRLELGLPNSR